MNTNFLLALEIMWKGMSGIFIVILLITLLVFLLSKIPEGKKSNDNK